MKKNVGWSLVLGLMALAGLQSCQLVAGAIEVAREVKDFPMEIKLHDGTMTVSGTSISYIAFRPGEEEGTVVCSSDSSKKRARKSLMEYFADDPDLCTALDDGEIGPFDFERICEAYDPAK